MISDHDRKHMRDIVELGYGDWFTADLLRLMARAAPDHREALRRAFPEVFAAYEEWQADPSPASIHLEGLAREFNERHPDFGRPSPSEQDEKDPAYWAYRCGRAEGELRRREAEQSS